MANTTATLAINIDDSQGRPCVTIEDAAKALLDAIAARNAIYTTMSVMESQVARMRDATRETVRRLFEFSGGKAVRVGGQIIVPQPMSPDGIAIYDVANLIGEE